MRTIGIDGLFNARATSESAPWLIRTGAPEALSAEGASTLRALGVSVIIDLREPSEIGASEHGIQVRSVGIYGAPPPQTGRLEDVYETLLRERGGALATAVGIIADAEGAALVHCTAGKDRTGLVVALARLAAGDSAEQVVADYVLSEPDVRPVRELHALALARELPATERDETLRLHLASPREAIEHALAVIDELGGAVAYLTRNGLSEAQRDKLRRKREAAA
ncbi:tyrosine-protein phosphatase [Microbacterium sp. AK031]|uniref:tyrosine-protein phosphatase n=1 Tax=Microbacterium sp. AK031 TaxID=2723076 RepID=UPI002166FBE8|nr:tyrosine-protein phosphatase [Microbacterium sp. AK031]MCS3844665.1 protein-tyrosine phosphatase [Microbacterium sp. AK031]